MLIFLCLFRHCLRLFFDESLWQMNINRVVYLTYFRSMTSQTAICLYLCLYVSDWVCVWKRMCTCTRVPFIIYSYLLYIFPPRQQPRGFRSSTTPFYLGLYIAYQWIWQAIRVWQLKYLLIYACLSFPTTYIYAHILITWWPVMVCLISRDLLL